MTDGERTEADGRQTGDPRTRRAWAVAAGTSLVGGVGLALIVGLLGGTGVDGFRVFLLVSSLGTAAAGLYATVTLLVDDLKKRPVGRSRIVTAVSLFVVTALLMAMVAGVGG